MRKYGSWSYRGEGVKKVWKCAYVIYEWSLSFLCPPNVAALWQATLTELISSIKSEDQRMVWLKDQYLFLYYQDDLCMGPLAADAIKVNTCLLYSLILTKYYDD